MHCRHRRRETRQRPKVKADRGREGDRRASNQTLRSIDQVLQVQNLESESKRAWKAGIKKIKPSLYLRYYGAACSGAHLRGIAHRQNRNVAAMASRSDKVQFDRPGIRTQDLQRCLDPLRQPASIADIKLVIKYHRLFTVAKQ